MARTRNGRRLRPYTFRPRLEALEDRNMMTAGALDPTFGTGGVAMTSVLPTYSGAFAMALQSDGKAVLVGDYAQSSTGGFAVVRFTTDGSLDPSFGTGGAAVIDGGSAQAVAIQPDGKIVVAGYGNGGFEVCRLNADGTLDTTFGSGGEQTIFFGAGGAGHSAYGWSMVLQPDGTIVVAGDASPTGGDDTFAIARLNPDGSLDTTFGTGGKELLSFPTTYSLANSLALEPDGKIVVAGFAQSANDTSASYAVARLNPDGSLDSSFGTGGEQLVTFAGSTHATADAVLVQPDGKVVLAGQVVTGSGSEAGIARLNSDGSLDPSFGTGGEVQFIFGTLAGGVGFQSASSLALQADGKLVVGGNVSIASALARLNPDGSFDATFAGGGREITGFAIARGVALTPDGKIVVAGGVSGQWAVVRYASDTSPFNYDWAPSKTLTITATNFAFSKSTTADASGIHTSYAFTANGVTLQMPQILLSSVVVNGGGTGSASLTMHDTYTGTDGQTHQTVESAVLGNGKGKLYESGGALPFLQLNGFTNIYAYMGHADSAALHATPGVANAFITRPSYSYLSAPGSTYVVWGARSVYGYAAGPADVAYQYGGAGPTTFVAVGTTYSSLTGTDHGIAYYNEAVGFTRNYAIAMSGSQSTAYFRATTSGEGFVGRTAYSYLYRLNPNGTFAELDYAAGFTHVFATAAAGAADYAYLYDTTVNHETGFQRLA